MNKDFLPGNVIGKYTDGNVLSVAHGKTEVVAWASGQSLPVVWPWVHHIHVLGHLWHRIITPHSNAVASLKQGVRLMSDSCGIHTNVFRERGIFEKVYSTL